MSLIHAEYLKISRRKLYPLMVMILAALVGLLAFVFMVLPRIVPDAASQGLPPVTKPGAYLFGAQQVAGQTWFPLILAVVMLGSEFGSTVWATTLTRDARRSAQVSSRFLVLSVASWVAVVLGIAGWAVVTLLAADGDGGPTAGDWLDVVWKVGLIEVAWTAIGLGAVAMFRSVGPAIGAALAFYFVDSFLILWQPYQNVSLSAATSSLFQVETPGDLGEFFGGGIVSLPHALAIMAGWTLLGLALTWWGLHRRDA
jgi:hypothetical protein